MSVAVTWSDLEGWDAKGQTFLDDLHNYQTCNKSSNSKVQVQVLFKEGKSKSQSTDHKSKSESKSSRKKRTCKQLCLIPVVFLLLLLYGNFT